MLRLSFLVCALIASATCAARPMLIHPAQTIENWQPGFGGFSGRRWLNRIAHGDAA